MLLIQLKRKDIFFWISIIQILGLLFLGIATYKSVAGSHDLNIYYTYSRDFLAGKVPYRDFKVEYPPFALFAFVFPRFLTILGLINNYHFYAFSFLLANILFSHIIFWILLRLMKSIYSQKQKKLALISYVIFSFIMAPIMLWRYDLFPTLLTCLALLALVYHRSTQAGICLGLGIAAKLYPMVLLPIFTIYYLVNKSYRALLNLWIGTFCAVFLTFLPFVITTNYQVFSFLSYHSERGLQVESLPSGIITLAHKWGLIDLRIVSGYGSINIASPLDDIVLNTLPWLFIIIYSLMLWNCVDTFQKDGIRENLQNENINTLITYSLLALLIFITTNKVFSPQYIVWIIPLAVFLKPRQLILMLAICISTYVIISYGSFRKLDYFKIIWLNLRNFLVLGLGVWIFLECLPSSVKAMIKRS